jgi:hypothetical protein
LSCFSIIISLSFRQPMMAQHALQEAVHSSDDQPAHAHLMHWRSEVQESHVMLE